MADNQAGEIGELLGMRPVAGRLQQSSIPARVSGSGALGSSPYYVWFARRLHVRVLNGRAWEIVVQQEVLVRLPHLLLVNPSRFLTPLTVWTYNVITKLCVHLWTWIILYDIHYLSSISAFARRWAKRCTSSGLVEYSYMSVCMYVCMYTQDSCCNWAANVDYGHAAELETRVGRQRQMLQDIATTAALPVVRRGAVLCPCASLLLVLLLFHCEIPETYDCWSCPRRCSVTRTFR